MLTGIVCAWYAFTPPPATMRVLADTGGALRSVAVSLASARRSALRNAPMVTEFVNALPASVQVNALTNDAGAFTVVPHDRPGQVRLVELPGNRDFTIWPQDPFLVLAGSDGSRELLLSATFERADDDLMAGALGSAMEFPLRRSKLAFEGGNILADETWIYVGANTVRINALRLRSSDEDVVRAFERELGGRVLVIGSLPQPVAHLDMMLTPLGDGRLLVADLQRGTQIADSMLKERPESVARFERDVHDTLFGTSDETKRSAGTHESMPAAPELVGATARVVSASGKAAGYFDRLAQSLEARGFDVERIPVLLDPDAPAVGGPGGLGGLGGSEGRDAYRGVLGYPVLTFNNVIIETRGGARIAYVPQYGFEALDNAGRATWERLGYRVQPVSGYVYSALYGGALRCTVKVLDRGPVAGL